MINDNSKSGSDLTFRRTNFFLRTFCNIWHFLMAKSRVISKGIPISFRWIALLKINRYRSDSTAFKAVNKSLKAISWRSVEHNDTSCSGESSSIFLTLLNDFPYSEFYKWNLACAFFLVRVYLYYLCANCLAQNVWNFTGFSF